MSTLSSDAAVCDAYLADPLNQHKSTVRFAHAAFGEQRRVAASLDRLAIPTLVVHGGDDGLVPPETSAASRAGTASPDASTRASATSSTTNPPGGRSSRTRSTGSATRSATCTRRAAKPARRARRISREWPAEALGYHPGN